MIFIKKLCSLILIVYFSFLVFCKKKTYDVTILYDRPPRTYDPHLRNEIVTISILSNIYEALVDYTPDLRIIPALAREWYRSDSLTWIFNLKENVYFHDGKELKVEDVIYSLYRSMRMESAEKSDLAIIIDTIYAINSHRLKIKTNFPYYFLLNELYMLYIIPNGYNDFKQPIGTGPYRVTHISEDSLVCKRYEDYWGKKPLIERGIFKFIPNLEARLEIFKKSESAIMYNVPIAMYYHLKDSIRFELISDVAKRYLQFNLKKPPFDNKEFRQALSMAINRQKIDDVLYYGLAEPANQFVFKGVIGYCNDLPALPYNPDSAKRLIGKFNKKTISFYYARPLQRLGNQIAQCLREAGLEVQENILEPDDFWHGVEQRKFDFILISAIVTNLDGFNGIIVPLFSTYNPAKGMGLMNRSGFSDPVIDSLIEFTIRVEDPEQRLNLIKEIQHILIDYMPIIPVVWEPRIYGISGNIKFKPRIDQTIRFKEIRF